MFGDYIQRCLLDKKWALRLAAVQSVQQKYIALQDSPPSLVPALQQVFRVASKDQNMKVPSSSFQCCFIMGLRLTV